MKYLKSTLRRRILILRGLNACRHQRLATTTLINRTIISLPVLLLLFAAGHELPLRAQGSAASVHGDFKPAAVDTPSRVKSSGLVIGEDIPALKSLASALSLSENWCGIDAEGTYETEIAGAPAQGTAHLSTRGIGYGRLDLSMNGNRQIYRSAGPLASMENEKGQRRSQDVASSMLGWFPLARLVSPESLRQAAWRDDGLVQLGDGSYNKVTYFASSENFVDVPIAFQRPYAVDYYFDPQSHLLIKAADLYRFPGSHHEELRVLIFGGYKGQGGSQLPTAITLAVNGQKVWSISFDSVAPVVCKAGQAFDKSPFLPKP